MLRYALLLSFFMTGFNTSGISGSEDDKHQIPEAAKSILEKADSFELFSLTPEPNNKKENDFHGFPVLGVATIKEVDVRKKIVDSFEKAVSENKKGPYKCFMPRHGIRVSANGKTADFVICFQCAYVQVFAEGKELNSIACDASPQKLLNDILTKAKIPLPEQAK